MLPTLPSPIRAMIAAIVAASAFEASAQALPYGAPISIDNAKKVSAAALVEARKNNWTMAVAITDPSGTLVYFERMDGGQYAAPESPLPRRVQRRCSGARPRRFRMTSRLVDWDCAT